MSDEPPYFFNILESRKQETGIFSFMTRNWKPQKTMILDKNYLPHDIKEMVSKSVYLDAFIEAESARSGVAKEELHKQVTGYLEEMGCDRKMHVVRWMGILFLKIAFMMKIKMFVSQPKVLELKSSMGSDPVLFLPTHRSYADFCLMTYLCYHYDIELPAVAAGIDFHAMAVMGTRMRETGAFYIRRSLTGAPLYSVTLKQYVRTLVSKYGAPVEFFLEGTRSRSNKSLPPKYGMLSMALMPYFAREVADIKIVPVSITYDRLMEQKLFAYEHIGVPKPKESTGGLLKALKSLNDNFGDIFINLGEPLSFKEYLSDAMVPTAENLKPTDLQQFTNEQFKIVKDIADQTIIAHQIITVKTVTNLVAMSLMQCFMLDYPMTFEEICLETKFMLEVLETRGDLLYVDDFKKSVEKVLLVHQNLMRVDKCNRLRLLMEPGQVCSEMKGMMKGQTFDVQTLSYVLPVIQLQLYVNPVLACLFPSAILYLITAGGTIEECDLAGRYVVIRKLLRYEFVYVTKSVAYTFTEELDYCLDQGIVVECDKGYTTEGGDEKLQLLYRWVAVPALATLKTCAEIMMEAKKCSHKQVLKLVQQRLLSTGCHPYSLSLEAAAACLRGLLSYGALEKEKVKDLTYTVVPDVMRTCYDLVSSILPSYKFSGKNSVMMEEKTASRL